LTASDRDESKSKGYFDSLYARNDDPWRMATRWYEERKRAITVASLPRQRYASALEVGCSVGELTAALATRCDRLLAVDISSAAVETATRRTAALASVRVAVADATVHFPEGLFDLVVLSEVAYYWDRATLRAVLAELRHHLAADGSVLACHWRHPVADYPLGGDESHEIIRAELAMTSLVIHDEEDFLLEVFSLAPGSVARQEGLLS
jgi:SAM-dependent methyltransferase